jgi:hypothetical protein
MTLEEPLQAALYDALPRLLPLFPSTISRRVVATLFLLPFAASSPASIAPASREERKRQHRFAVRALESLHDAQGEAAKLAPPVVAELHQTVLEVYRRLRGPVRVVVVTRHLKGAAAAVRARIDARRLELLTLVTSSMVALPPLLLESSLPADGYYTRQAEERMKAGAGAQPKAKKAAKAKTTKEAEEEEVAELEAAGKGITLRCLLVERKVLPLASLHACRTWCLSQSGGMPVSLCVCVCVCGVCVVCVVCVCVCVWCVCVCVCGVCVCVVWCVCMCVWCRVFV